MAQFQMDGLDDLMSQLESMADMTERAPRMIDAAAPILVKNLKKNIGAAVSLEYSTGELAASVKATNAKINQYGCFAAISVSGKDHKGVRNAEKLAYMEYGTSKQLPHPVLQKSVNESETHVLEKMQEVFNAEVGE